jgi:dTDP-4-dehydrorhamnose 3,5-epimerase
VSKKGVLRGLHFQLPPADHAKAVYCVEGRVIDAVVDLRVGSPTYGQGLTYELDAAKGNGLYIPRGFAHGFYVPVDKAVFVYKIETPWVPALDAGIAWDSAGLDWPDKSPVLSEKDGKLPKLKDFQSPFKYIT